MADRTPWLNSQGFVNVCGQNWSLTTAAGPGIGEGVYAQGVNFLTGETGITAKIATSYLPAIWPVRGTSHGSAPLAKTGQTKSYAKYDDGHYQAGIAWPPGRFQMQGECVTDRLTGGRGWKSRPYEWAAKLAASLGLRQHLEPVRT